MKAFGAQYIWTYIFCGLTSLSLAQNEVTMMDPGSVDSVVEDSYINPDRLKTHLSILASDEMEGRETGEPGNEKAAAYIASQIKSIGLLPVDEDGDYMQPFLLNSSTWDVVSLHVRDQEYRHLWDFYCPKHRNGMNGPFSLNEVMFVGYGITNEVMDNYAGRDVTGKAVMMYAGEPLDENGLSIITGEKRFSEWGNNPFMKIKLAKENGASHVFMISDHFKAQVASNRTRLLGPSVTLAKPDENGSLQSTIDYTIMSPELAKAMLGKKIKKVKKQRSKIQQKKSSKVVTVKTDVRGHFGLTSNDVVSQNVMGLIPGAINPDEYIVISAHYDHLGKRGNDIFNGADDNGSGSAALLTMVEEFMSNRRLVGPRPLDRSLLFIWVSGEEKGLLGSRYYTDHEPIIPLEKIMVNVNVDMIGRKDKHHDDANYIYVIGADRLSTTLHDVNEAVNLRGEQLELDYTYNAEDDPNRYYYRSDHYNFAKNDIPSIFFFSGVHEDYHRPSDTVEKIDFDKMTKIVRHIYQLVHELGSRSERIEVNTK